MFNIVSRMICILVSLFYAVGVHGFRKDFIWGVTSAAYPIEGGYVSDGKLHGWNCDIFTLTTSIIGKGLSNWDYFTSKYMNETGNVTSDSYHNLNADLLLLKQLNVTHYKFSISWSRIFPQGTTDIINKKGLSYYKSLISGLKSLNIQPILTLLHYDLPLSVESIGGFQNDAIVPLFLSYASFILDFFKDDVKTWITIEDPFGMAMNSYGGTKINWAPGGFSSDNAETTIYNAFYNILKCHGKVGQLFKAKYKSKDNQIGLSFTVNSPFPLDTEVTTTFDMYMDFTLGLLSSPVFSPNGNYPDSILRFFQTKTREEGRSVSRLRLFSIDEIKEIRNSSDFIGLNYFGGQLLSSGGKKEIQFNQIGKELGIEFVNDNLHLNKASYWPGGLSYVLRYLRKNYLQTPILITGNGIVENGHISKEIYLKEHLSVVRTAINQGVNVIGYCVYSLMDGYEWDEGFSAKMGMYKVNFTGPNKERSPRKVVDVYNNYIMSNK